MRRLLWPLALILVCGGLVLAQDESPAQLKQDYEDAREKLKQAQERKNELSTQLADVQKRLDATQAKLDDASRAAADYARNTFFLRAHYAAWHDFVSHYPKIEHQWEIYLADGAVSSSPAATQELFDTNWPLPSGN